ncbi:MAG: hypothetical protein D6715_09325 [Calditrichaeota bacterium]|nr:MAG: hypothetical protein D6715_09325 [Calditrichota bacterium]
MKNNRRDSRHGGRQKLNPLAVLQEYPELRLTVKKLGWLYKNTFKCLTDFEKEMIFFWVSFLNKCSYCCISHGFPLIKLSKDPDLPAKLIRWETDALAAAQHRTVLEFVAKFTRHPYDFGGNDLARLQKAGYSKKAVEEIILMVAIANLVNRIVTGFQAELPEHLKIVWEQWRDGAWQGEQQLKKSSKEKSKREK